MMAEDRAARIAHRLLSPQSSWEQFERTLVSQQRPPSRATRPPALARHGPGGRWGCRRVSATARATTAPIYSGAVLLDWRRSILRIAKNH